MPLYSLNELVVMRFLSIVLLSLSLGACDEARQNTSAVDPDIELMNDPGTAGPELEKRLVASVSVQDGLIIVRALASNDTYVLPDNSPWVITCGGEGVSVTFGSAVSGDGSHVGNDVGLDLTMIFISQANCGTLAPQLGRRLKAMLQEPAHPQ
jgi:hypothetical protein